MTLKQLQRLIDAGDFHHATERPNAGGWSGLHIYRRTLPSDRAPVAFQAAGFFRTTSRNYDAALALVVSTGVPIGQRGWV